MKALTISQPFASLIASGEKWVENRTWETKYRGPLAIHAGKGKQYLSKAELEKFPTGCVIAIAELIGCAHLGFIKETIPPGTYGGVSAKDIIEHEHTEGPWCWILQDVKKLEEPIPCRGAQGLWEWQGENK